MGDEVNRDVRVFDATGTQLSGLGTILT